MSSNQVPLCFIVGCPRSGTTLLQRIVNAHSLITIVPEIFWITHFVNAHSGPRLEDPISVQNVRALMDHKRFPELQLSRDEFERLLGGKFSIPCGDFITSLFEEYRDVQRKPFVGNKTPQYVQNIPTFHARWPSAKFIHIIRDGRDVALSVLNWKKADRTAGRFATWTDDRVSTAALWWRRNVLLGREAGNQIGPQLYYEIHYESLILRPQEECVKLCSFLDLPYDEQMLHHDKDRPQTNRVEKSWSPITAGMRDWKSQMLPDDVARFEASAGPLISELGYERATDSPSSERSSHAARIYEIFTRDVQTSHKLLPVQW
jgi:hypothetical protein